MENNGFFISAHGRYMVAGALRRKYSIEIEVHEAIFDFNSFRKMRHDGLKVAANVIIHFFTANRDTFFVHTDTAGWQQCCRAPQHFRRYRIFLFTQSLSRPRDHFRLILRNTAEHKRYARKCRDDPRKPGS